MHPHHRRTCTHTLLHTGIMAATFSVVLPQSKEVSGAIGEVHLLHNRHVGHSRGIVVRKAATHGNVVFTVVNTFIIVIVDYTVVLCSPDQPMVGAGGVRACVWGRMCVPGWGGRACVSSVWKTRERRANPRNRSCSLWPAGQARSAHAHYHCICTAYFARDPKS